MHGAQARAAAQMGDDHARPRGITDHLRKHAGDVFIGKAVKTITPYAFVMERAGQGETPGHIRLAGMERRVEAGDLRQVWMQLRQRPNGCQIVRLMQRRQRHQRLQPRHHGFVYTRRHGEFQTAMYHPVSGGHQPVAKALLQPGQQEFQRRAL